MGIEYFEGQSESNISNYIQEGWYFISWTYEFKEGVNLSTNFSREVSVFAKDKATKSDLHFYYSILMK